MITQFNEPTDQDVMLVKEIMEIYFESLRGSGKIVLKMDGEEMELPKIVLNQLGKSLQLISEGRRVVMSSPDTMYSTAQAADILNVSRVYFSEEILKKGLIDYEEVGTHRRVSHKNLMKYKEQQKAARKRAMKEMQSLTQEMENEKEIKRNK